MDRRDVTLLHMVQRSSRLVGHSLTRLDRHAARRSATMEAIAEARHGIALARIVLSRRAIFRS